MNPDSGSELRRSHHLLKAPFPWFGGKSQVAAKVWDRFGDVPNYVEPFAGSLAVLLRRPHAPRVETVNDLDAFICNVWRAIAWDPEGVAHHADWPVSEVDLHARHAWLIERRDELAAQLVADPEFYDSRVAGWWAWGASLWIGTGWCRSQTKQRPHLSASTGVHRDVDIGAWIQTLRTRLRRVRVVCGDFERVLGANVTYRQTGRNVLTGILLDPPYLLCEDLYSSRSADLVSHRAYQWALENGDNHLLRIAVCGRPDEFSPPENWEELSWTTNGGYGNAKGGHGNAQRRERVWFSPHCLSLRQGTLF